MVSRLRPLARRRFSTLRPVGVAIRARNPCVRFRLRLLGWYVLFIGKGFLNHAPGTKSILGRPGRAPGDHRASGCSYSSSGLSLRAIRSITAFAGSLSSYRTSYICSVIGISTPTLLDRLRTERVLRTPSATSLMLAMMS